MYRTFRIIALAVLLLALLVLIPAPRFVFAEIIEYDLTTEQCIAPYEECYLDEWHYEDPSISVAIETGRIYETNYMAVRVKIANASQLRTAFSGTYYAPDLEYVSTVAQYVNAVVAINGDYYSEEKRVQFGYTARQGKVYKNKNTLYFDTNEYYDILVIDDQGDFHIERGPTPQYMREELPYTPVNGFTFGPVLILDGKVLDCFPRLDYGASGNNQRMAIAQVGPLEYMMICSEGKEDPGSVGLTIEQFAELCGTYKDIQICYNLDGGSSTTVAFRGRKVNSPANPKIRPVPDIIYFATAYIPE